MTRYVLRLSAGYIMKVTAEAVRQALGAVQDPLLAQSLVDLGLVYDVQATHAGRVLVALILPSSHWPGGDVIVRSAHDAIAALPHVASVDVRLVDEPPWSPYRMVQALQAPLDLPAIEPPPPLPPALPSHSRVRRVLHRLLSQ
jgi:metal-sulfur cluster biosynthetic enzyme